jgi:hypothetical protein
MRVGVLFLTTPMLARFLIMVAFHGFPPLTLLKLVEVTL